MYLRPHATEAMRSFAGRLSPHLRAKLEGAWALIDEAEQFIWGPPAWDDRARAARATGVWPDDIAVVQVSGGSRWGAYREKDEIYGWTPPLVDERFLGVVRDVAGTDGWTAVELDARTTKWERQPGHRALLVPGEFPLIEGISVPGGETPNGEGIVEWGVAADALRDADGPHLLWSEHGLHVSPEVAAALRAARLPSVRLEPLRYASEV